jgi:hypothetical protein
MVRVIVENNMSTIWVIYLEKGEGNIGICKTTPSSHRLAELQNVIYLKLYIFNTKVNVKNKGLSWINIFNRITWRKTISL